ncbi:hypothetical protein DL96DRAFT_1245557 [Flagelloscypha sp. PMI_526]|nr:hypothetical protein DL96DRAFT_1245557 [Flagelloscypha sp. PMI_526]
MANLATPSSSSSSTPNLTTAPPFTPRPFPPPSLKHVPVEYIISQLRSLAVHYWNKPASADCTLVIPVPHAKRTPSTTPTGSPSLLPPNPTPSFALPTQIDPSGMGRRESAPATPTATPTLPRLVLKAHMDYLTAHSTLLRGVFCGASPLDLVLSNQTTTTIVRDGPTPSRIPVPASRLPRLLPSSPQHPILYLPVPDPSSIQSLFHWMYFGTTDGLQEALEEGKVQWEGVARNVEYLGLPTEMKVFLGRYYKTWIHTGGGSSSSGSRFDIYLELADEEDDDSDCEDNESDCDSDDTAYDTCCSDLDEDEEPVKGFDDFDLEDPVDDGFTVAESATVSVADDSDDIGKLEDLDDMWRGRSRQTRCVSTSFLPDDPPLNFSENKRWSA